MIRMKMVTEIGLFDPRFFLYFEETDFCKRALDCGWQIWAIGTAVGRHENGVSAKEERQDMYHGCIAEHYFKSRHYYLRKHYGWAIAKAVGICEFIATCLSYTGKRLFNRDRQRTAIRLHSTFLRTPKKRVVDV
jgi:N-acetylglucosaminyl-diphospho-decaprenol L-rhamnosyltransferase